MHSMLLFIMVAEVSFTAALINPKVKVKTEYDLGPCNNANHGRFTLVKNNENKERLVICTLENGVYHWTTTGGRSSSGEFFNPGYDCSEILNKNPKATDGFYWVNFNEATSRKVYCDMNTDGGGYMLIAKKNDPETWSVPSNSTPVDPFGNYPHWSSSFGNAPILDFRIQVSSTSKFQETRAHWSYRLQKKRPLKNLMVLNEGGCARRSPGIGYIAYVKDLMTGKIVSTTFRCSIFSGYSLKSAKVGWSMMNICLKEECSGFGVNHKYKYQTSDTGAFSYSATNTASGITKAATAFLGCDIGKCCACYGPVGGTGDYCDTECRAKNGGTVIKNVHTWVWLRSSLPKTLWTKCMEYEATSEAGQKSWYSIVGNTGEPQKGRCPGYTELRLNDGTIVAQDGNAFKKIPAISGLLSYRKDNKKLYVSSKNSWIALSTEDKYDQVSAELKRLEKKFETLGIVDYLNSSPILNGTADYIRQLRLWLPVYNTSHLCWRASQHGWASTTFHSRCDNKGSTVTIVRVGKYIFGGYADVSWKSTGGWVSSVNAFLFSLKNKDNLEPFKAAVYQYSQRAFYHRSDLGPVFGRSGELVISNNANLNTNSYTNFGGTYQPPPGYTYGAANTQALLAGTYTFTPSEVEVFYLQ